VHLVSDIAADGDHVGEGRELRRGLVELGSAGVDDQPPRLVAGGERPPERQSETSGPAGDEGDSHD
jgi:hypothetical protein